MERVAPVAGVGAARRTATSRYRCTAFADANNPHNRERFARPEIAT